MKVGASDFLGGYVGTAPATRVYLGNTLVWSETSTTLTILSIGPQQSNGDVPLSYEISNDRLCDAVLFSSALADPVAGDFNGGNVNYTDIGQQTLAVVGGSVSFTLPGEVSGNFKVAFLTSDGVIAVSPAFALNTTTPGLSGVSFTTGSGTGEVDWAFTPDVDSASVTGYRVSLFPDGSTPTDAERRDGTGSVATVTGVATASVQESGTLAATAGTTYVPTIYYIDNVGNDVANTYADVLSGGTPPPAGSITFVSQQTYEEQGEDVSQIPEGHNLPTGLQQNDIVVAAVFSDDQVLNGSTATVQRVTVDATGQGWTVVSTGAGSSPGYTLLIKRMGVTPDTSLEVIPSNRQRHGVIFQAWRGVDTVTAQDATATVATAGTGAPDAPSITTTTNNALVLACGFLDDRTTLLTAPSGYANLVNARSTQFGANSSATAAIASKVVTTAGAEDPGAFAGDTGVWAAVTMALRSA